MVETPQGEGYVIFGLSAEDLRQASHYSWAVISKQKVGLRCTVVQNSQESGPKYWATRLSDRLFTRAMGQN